MSKLRQIYDRAVNNTTYDPKLVELVTKDVLARLGVDPREMAPTTPETSDAEPAEREGPCDTRRTAAKLLASRGAHAQRTLDEDDEDDDAGEHRSLPGTMGRLPPGTF